VLEVAVGPDGLARVAAVIEGLDPTLDACVAQVAADTVYQPTVAGGIVVMRHALRFAPESAMASQPGPQRFEATAARSKWNM
jgi:hypothetical protein